MNRLYDLRVSEVSLVSRGANRKKFLILKEDDMSNLLETILEAELEDEAKVDEVLKAQGLSEKAINAVKGALRILNAFKDELPKDILNTLASLAGYGYAQPVGQSKAKDKDKDMDEDEEYGEPKKSKKTGAPVRKEDGSWDFSAVPEEVRPMVETIFKEHEAAVRKAQELEQILKAEQDRRVTAEFIERARHYSHLPVNPQEFGPVLKCIHESVPEEVYTKLETVLKAADENLRLAEALKPVGRDTVAGGSAWDQIMALAQQRVQKEQGMTLAKAVDAVLRERPDLYARYNAEQKK